MANYRRSKEAFNSYCAMGEGRLPEDPISRHQVEALRFCRPDPLNDVSYAMGAIAELGKLATTVFSPGDVEGLEYHRVVVATRLNEAISGLMNIATANRLDFGELCKSEKEIE